MANPNPTITFTLNLSNPDSATLLPYSNQLNGNQTTTEAAAQINARSTWLPTLTNGDGSGGQATGAGGSISAKNAATIVAYGLNALYLKRTYVNGPGGNLLTVVSEVWS
jgi:hypothetical protein